MEGGDEVEGTVAKVLPNALFEVVVPGGRRVLTHLSDELRLSRPRVVPGDNVRIRVSPYDRSRGRIVSHERSPRS